MNAPRRNWESYSVLTMDERRVSEPRLLARHWTRKGAVRWAKRIVNTPQVLALSLESALTMRNGHMVFANAAIRDRRVDGEPQFVYPEDLRKETAS